jgi:tetratricopeptide (TPR) repeat protein
MALPIPDSLRRAALAGSLLVALASWWPGQALAAENVQALITKLKAPDVSLRNEALMELAERGDATAVPAVVEALRDDNQGIRQVAEQTLWAIWMHSGDERVDRELLQGTSLMAQGLLEEAIPFFDQVIAEAPDFAEGYNKRATALYHLGRLEASMADIAETLKRNPYHFGALSGQGLCLIGLDRYEEAIKYFDKALAINPNMEGVRHLRSVLARKLKKPLV